MYQQKEISNAQEYIKELTRIFNRLNKHFWNSELPEVVITLVPTQRAAGHCSVSKVWSSEDGNQDKYEINISSAHVSEPDIDVAGIMLHEQVHLYCRVHDIKETSRGHVYHNREFRRIAMAHGLNADYDPKIGWSLTSLDEDAQKYVKKLNIKKFVLSREYSAAKTPLIRYQCPNHESVVCWCSKPQNICCGICGTPLLPTPSSRGKKKEPISR